MASVRLGRYEAMDGRLPRLCMRCGAPAAMVKAKTFSWQPGWVFFVSIPLGLLGLLLFLVLSFFLTKRMRVQVPLCERHRYHWAIRSWLVLGGLVLLLALAMGVIGLQAELGRLLGAGNNVGGMLWVGLGVLGLIWLIGVAIGQSRAIRPTEITAKRIRLVGVSPEFVQALDDGREAEEGYEDVESPRRRRRPADSRQYYDPDAARRQTASDQFYDPDAARSEKPWPQPPHEEL